MKNVITVTGIVSTDPLKVVTDDGLDIVSFALASTHYNHDPHTSTWVDPDVNRFIVTAFRQLAVNAHTSVFKGNRVIVTGGLRIRDWSTAERTGTQVEIEATVIGHDLNWGTSDWHYTSVKLAAEEETVAEDKNEISETDYRPSGDGRLITDDPTTPVGGPRKPERSRSGSSSDDFSATEEAFPSEAEKNKNADI